MRKNDNFTDGCEAGPGRPKLLRAVIDQQQLTDLTERVLLIGQTCDDEALAVMALDAVAHLVAAVDGKASAKPEPKAPMTYEDQWKP